ncbi:hypothetical protein U1Q18_046296 [Sarracenia purpurea var. burkii]
MSCRALPERWSFSRVATLILSNGVSGCPCEEFAPGPGTRMVEERGVPRLEKGKLAEKERDGAGGSSATVLLCLSLLSLSLHRGDAPETFMEDFTPLRSS